jgi:GR25 family glycosyltransferase involved in LPS biosynthesis
MKTLCLTLPEQPKRLARAKERFAKHGVDVHFVQGINGYACGLKSTHPYEVDSPGSGYVIGEKPIGIYLSHYIMWSVCDAFPDEYFLLLEDDVILTDGFIEKMNQALNHTPKDFDFLFLGSCCTGGEYSRQIIANIYEVHYPQCMHAYVLAKKAVPVLLRSCRDIYAPIDCLLRLRGFFGLRVYTVIPRMVEQFETVIPP